MSEKFYEIKGHTVAGYIIGGHEVWNIPVLVGRDTDRKRGWTEVSFPISASEDGPIRGWGDLDCERSYSIRYGVKVPCELLETLAAMVGGEIRMDERQVESCP